MVPEGGRPHEIDPAAYGGPVAINPGWPVAIACLLLLALTLTTYAVGRLPNAPGTAVAAGRAVLQLGVAALVITSVVRNAACTSSAGAALATYPQRLTR